MEVDEYEYAEEIEQTDKSVQTTESFLLANKAKIDLEIKKEFVSIFGKSNRKSYASREVHQRRRNRPVFDQNRNEMATCSSLKSICDEFETITIDENSNVFPKEEEKLEMLVDKKAESLNHQDPKEDIETARNEANPVEKSEVVDIELREFPNLEESDTDDMNQNETTNSRLSVCMETFLPPSDNEIIFGNGSYKTNYGKWTSPRINWLDRIEQKKSQIFTSNIVDDKSKYESRESPGRPPNGKEEKTIEDFLADGWGYQMVANSQQTQSPY